MRIQPTFDSDELDEDESYAYVSLGLPGGSTDGDAGPERGVMTTIYLRHIQLNMNASSNGGPDNAAPTSVGIAKERNHGLS